VGKSRVANEMAAEAAAGGGAAGEREEVALVELAPLADPAQVPARVAGMLGLAEEPAHDLGARLMAHLARRRLLLVLDNCEHLVGACADLAHELLSTCPQVRVLSTSQIRLQVPGETTWVLAPLVVPPLGVRLVEDVLASDAGALFVARASAARPGLLVDDADGAVIARLCRRLDGLPLALELAAAHARLRSLDEIARELDVRFDLLAGGPRTGPAHHQTLRATLDWSYGGFTDGQARLLARLSVFAGGFDFEAARAVASDDPDDAPTLYRDLTDLVDASLVQADSNRRVTRYGLLEAVRHHARERLETSGEAALRSQRHLAWATSLAEAAAPELGGARQRELLDHLEQEHANLRAALAWAVSGDAARSALPLAAALGRYWEVRGHLCEGRAWLDRALADPQRPPELASARARALGAAAALAQRQGADDVARSWLEESLTIHRVGGDLAGEAAALHGLGLLDARTGDVSSARSRYLNSLAIGRQLGAVEVVATALANLGWLAQCQADFATARTLLMESLQALGERRWDAAAAEGRVLAPEAVVGEARRHLRPGPGH
jgi:non-specific serine/threonine protein kinase